MFIATVKTRFLIALSMMRGVGPAALRRFIAELSSVSGFDSLSLFENITGHSRHEFVQYESEADRLLERCGDLNISVVSALDEAYSPPLSRIKDFPPILYIRGDTQKLRSKPSVAIVGTRECSDLGASLAYKLAKVAAENGVSVVSGLARGIDTHAHRGALAGNGTTIAVLAHGLDTIAPASNRPLAAEILESGGVLISEHPPGVPPRPPEFVRRNRIQSGLSLASIIVETGVVGGAIHQARFTREQNRALFVAWPDADLIEQSGFKIEGAKLLRSTENARPLRSSDELLRYLQSHASNPFGGPQIDLL